MCVSLLLVIISDERLDEDITGAFCVFHGHTRALVDRKTYLKRLSWLRIQLPYLSTVTRLRGRINVNPEVDDTLVESTTLVI